MSALKIKQEDGYFCDKGLLLLHLTAGSACVFKTSRSVQVFPGI